MADINDYLDGLNYSLTNDEKQLMDIFAECWEYCREHSCGSCEFRQSNKYVKMLPCMSYQYARRLLDKGIGRS